MTVTAATPVVFIHGVGLDGSMWAPVIDCLAARVVRAPAESDGQVPAIAPDMLGHGHAPKPPGPYRLDDFVDNLTAQLDAHASDTTTVDVVGFSMGALVAQLLALRQPHRVRRLVLIGGVFDRSPAERAAVVQRVADVRNGGYTDSIAAAIERWFTPEFAEQHPEVVDSVRTRMAANDERAYADAYEVFATADAELTGKVHRISQPTLVITGGDDQRSTPAMARALAARLPNGRAHVVDRARHMLPLEQPDVVAGLIGTFLAGSESGQTDERTRHG